MRQFFAARGFKTEGSNPNYEWRLSSELFEDYASVRRLTALATEQGKSTRVLCAVQNADLENQPLYWALLTLNPGSYYMEPIVSPAGTTSLAPLSVMARASAASAAINAGFFAVSGRNTGSPIGTLRRGGVLVSKPYQGRTCLGWSKDNRAAFGEVDWEGKVILANGWLALNSLNHYVKGNVVTLYNAYYGRTTPANVQVTEAVIENGRCVTMNTSGGTAIKEGHCVIAAYGTNARLLAENMAEGDAVRLEDVFNNGDPNWASMSEVIQAGPFLIRQGEIGIEPEGFSPSILNLRHPRSVIGLTKEGKWVFFVGDGRDGTHSAGFTLREVSDVLLGKNVLYALNLDGGGSSQLVINGKIFNSPSEKRERPISYGVGAKPKK
jgi:exopolysaccharide biosynthesis protein